MDNPVTKTSAYLSVHLSSYVWNFFSLRSGIKKLGRYDVQTLTVSFSRSCSPCMVLFCPPADRRDCVGAADDHH